MKLHYYLKISLLVSLINLVSACGQIGPLYLPTDTPPITVAPDVKEQNKVEKQIEEAAESKAVEEAVKTKVVEETPPDLNEEN